MGRKNRKTNRVKFCGPFCLCQEDELYHRKMKELAIELSTGQRDIDSLDDLDEWGYDQHGNIIDLR